MHFPRCLRGRYLPVGLIRRNYSTADIRDASKTRNMALVAHIGVSAIFLCVQNETDSSHRLGENNPYGIYTFEIVISLSAWNC